jgi:hypothetical protein
MGGYVAAQISFSAAIGALASSCGTNSYSQKIPYCRTSFQLLKINKQSVFHSRTIGLSLAVESRSSVNRQSKVSPDAGL